MPYARYVAVVLGCLASLLPVGCAADGADQGPPLAQHEALATFRMADDVKLELVAAEPLVESPVAAAFLSPSRLLVVENRDYPTGPPPGQPPQGRVSLLTDSDGDGQFDQRATFADGLTFPSGVMPCGDGALVTCAPDILFLADRDGDGRAEFRQTLLTGFSTAGSTQLRVSHPLLAPDGWIYVCGGLTGGKIRRPEETDEDALPVGRADIRFQIRRLEGSPPKLEIAQYEMADGGAQFGQTFDDLGRRFICYNRVQAQHVVLSSRILQRNRHLAFAETVQNCPAEMVAEPLAGHGAAARIFPLSQNVTTADSHAGTFTAACGVTVCRAGGLPLRYHGTVFSCDPTANLVHVDVLSPNGATFSARPMFDGAEALASVDNSFRPVNLFHGPDGALYVCDMYRRTIEHPDYLPEEIRKHTDFETGKNQGRIWRLTSHNKPSTAAPSWFENPTLEQLIGWLRRGDGWWRDEAARRLTEWHDSAAVVAALQGLVAEKNSWAEATIRALWLLEHFGRLELSSVYIALADVRPAVREGALTILAARPATKNDQLQVAALCRDGAGPRERFLAAIALGGLQERKSTACLAKLALKSADDRWTRAAVLSSIAEREDKFYGELLDELREPSPLDERVQFSGGIGDLFQELGAELGVQDDDHGEYRGPAPPSEVESRRIANARWDMVIQSSSLRPVIYHDLAAAFMTGISRAEWAHVQRRTLDFYLTALFPDRDPIAEAAWPVIEWAKRIAPNADAPPFQRERAIAFLAHVPAKLSQETLLELLNASQPNYVQLAAIESLAGLPDASAASDVFSRFDSLTPAVQQRALQVFLADPRYADSVLEAIEGGRAPAGVVDSIGRQKLLQHVDEAIRQRAQRLFDAIGSPSRQQVYDEWKDVVKMAAVPANGQAVFRRLCTQCHRLDREGFLVGPDLFGIRNQPKAAILLHILVPEREITPGFVAYTVELRDGRTLAGLLTAETKTGVTLRQPQGKEETIRRADIERLEAKQLSLMPQDFDRQISRQEMADLLAYLKGER